MKFRIIILSVLLSSALTQSLVYAKEINSDFDNIETETESIRTKTPIEGMDGYYVIGESYPMACDCYIADEKGNRMTSEYMYISTVLEKGELIEVSVRAGMTDSRSGYINKEFKEIVPCEYGNMTIKEENGFIYIEAPHIFDDKIDYYDIDGNKIEDIYEITKSMKNNRPTDLGCDSWAKNDILSAISNNIVPENLQSNYRAKITREEFCELAVKTYFYKKGGGLIWRGEYEAPISPFNDVDNVNVSRAYMLGIVSGTGNGNFSPNSFITRQEAAVMLCNLASVLDLDANIEESTERFVDESYFADWAKDSIYKICSIKCQSGTPIMAGTGNGKFSPWFNYQRQQAIVTMERLYETQSDTTEDYRQSFKADIDTIADSYVIGNIENSLFTKENYDEYMSKWYQSASEGTESSYISELDDAYRTTGTYLSVCDELYKEEGADKEEIEKIADNIISDFKSIVNMREEEILNFYHGNGELSVFGEKYKDSYFRILNSGIVDDKIF